MDLYEAIRRRRSVRDYQEKPVEQDKLDRILEAARLAPSASNRQAWRFIVVRDAAKRRALAQASDQDFVGQAPIVLAAVSLEPDRLMHCQVPAGPVDCAIALEHMALAAVAEGLGTCWIGAFYQDQVRQVLEIPPEAKVIELLTLGYPADRSRPKTRKALGEIVCYDRWV